MILTFESLPVPIEADKQGVLRVGGTRVTLESILERFDAGDFPEEIVGRFPVLRLADVYAVMGYCLQNRSRVDRYLRQCRRETTRTIRQIRRDFPSKGLRQRLVTRRRKLRRA